MLAYVFWHRPRDPAAVAGYERAQLAFHRSLAHNRPMGMLGSACFRVAEIPWLEQDAPLEAQRGTTGAGYEDWYLVEDFTALGVLNESAVAHGHRTLHDEAARRFGAGAAGVYALVEGKRGELPAGSARASWVGRPAGTQPRPLGELLGDGIEIAQASLWRRQMVLGPAPEFCLFAGADSPGIAATRLPAGWTATTIEHEELWHG